jgi:hypothetical protein
MADDELTLAEISRAIRRMESMFTTAAARIEANFNNYIPREVYDAKHKAMEDRVDELEESRKVYARMIVGAILAALVPTIVLLFRIKVPT